MQIFAQFLQDFCANYFDWKPLQVGCHGEWSGEIIATIPLRYAKSNIMNANFTNNFTPCLQVANLNANQKFAFSNFNIK